jgi:hypothetical protein
MNELQVKQLFTDLFGDKFEFYGLFVELFEVELIITNNQRKFYNFNFKITNPNDVSYYSLPFDWEIDEMLKDFSKYVDVSTRSNVFLDTNQGKLYFNKEKTKEIENAFKKIDKIKFTLRSNILSKDLYEVKIESVGYKKYYQHEHIQLVNVIKPVSATKNGESYDVDKVILKYYEEFLPQEETYWESENLYLHLDQILTSIPSIGGYDVIVLEYTTKLFRK